MKINQIDKCSWCGEPLCEEMWTYKGKNYVVRACDTNTYDDLPEELRKEMRG